MPRPGGAGSAASSTPLMGKWYMYILLMAQARQLIGNAAATVLGMIALGARSGYEIKSAGDRSFRFFWALGPPQIYAELQRLEEAGLIKGTEEARGRRRRRTFSITRAGRRALHDWLAADHPAPLEVRDPELLRLFFADELSPQEVREHVAAMRRRSERVLARFEQDVLPAAERTAERGFAYPREVARFGVELHEFIVGWCERMQGRVEDA
jgi:PadR family transcriptional regulator AphA